MRVLIADDDIDALRLLARILNNWGHQVVAVNNGAKALTILQAKEPPSLAILDWNMPELDGIDVIRRVRSDSIDDYVYIILLSARTSREDMMRGLDLGADDYMTKPFNKGELHARIAVGRRMIYLKEEFVLQNRLLKTLNDDLAKVNKRMQRDLQLAAEFQKSLFPQKLPSPDGVRIEWLFKPCEELAGDILNVFWLDGEHLGFYLLDVSGHGVAASFLTGIVSRTLTPLADQSCVVRKKIPGSAKHHLVSPAEVVAELNTQFQFDNNTKQYFTIVYGILDVQQYEVRLACAGHPSPILTGLRRQPGLVEVKGVPIGFLKDGGYGEEKIQLEPGDRLYLYSDGIKESMSDQGELFGEDRLRDALHQHVETPLCEAMANCVKAAEQWGAGEVDDDISMLGIEIMA